MNSYFHLFIFCTACFVFFLEYVWPCWLLPLTWTPTPNSASLKVLLVADPRIEGVEKNGNGIVGDVKRWDADNYLRKTFRAAVYHTNPNVIIFLGDLLDEGDIAGDIELESYVQRFNFIFDVHNLQNERKISILTTPGDKDIGKDRNRLVQEKRLKQFANYFPSPPCSSLGTVVFVEINSLSESKCQKSFTHATSTIAYTHFGLMQNEENSSYAFSMLNSWKPDIVFAGHNHSAVLLSEKETEMQYPPDNQDYWKFTSISGEPVEIHVPTCSYRIMDSKAGYGIALIDTESEEISYKILWMHSRYFQLITYEIICCAWMIAIFWVLFKRITEYRHVMTGENAMLV